MKKLPQINKKTKILALMGGVITLLGLCFSLGIRIAEGVDKWWDTHDIVVNRKVLEVQVNKPIEIVDREIPVSEIIKVINEAPLPDDLTDIEQYICEKWGPYNCKLALSVAKAESGMREDAVNVYNKNGTYDTGIFQVNSIHQSKEGCSLKELVDAKKNVDCAYKIWEASGWGAWSAYNSGAFKDKLE